MPFDVAGNFTRDYNWVADRTNGIAIQAVRHDANDDDFAAGFNQVILRNGVVPFSGTVKLGNNIITGLSVGTVGAPSASFAGDATTGFFQPTATTFAISIGGTEQARWTVNGQALKKLIIDPAAFTGTPRTPLDVHGLSSFRGAFEDVVVTAFALTGTVNLDYLTASVYMFTPNAAANWTFNLRGDATTSLDSIMGIGQMLSIAIEAPQGATPYYMTAITVDGAAPASIKWGGGLGAPTAGNASGIDVYLFRVTKTAAGQFQVRGSMAQEK